MVLGYAISLMLLSRAIKTVELSVAYAVWAAVGTAIIAVASTVLFGDPMNALKAFGLVLIVVGVAAVNLAGGPH